MRIDSLLVIALLLAGCAQPSSREASAPIPPTDLPPRQMPTTPLPGPVLIPPNNSTGTCSGQWSQGTWGCTWDLYRPFFTYEKTVACALPQGTVGVHHGRDSCDPNAPLQWAYAASTRPPPGNASNASAVAFNISWGPNHGVGSEFLFSVEGDGVSSLGPLVDASPDKPNRTAFAFFVGDVAGAAWWPSAHHEPTSQSAPPHDDGTYAMWIDFWGTVAKDWTIRVDASYCLVCVPPELRLES